MRRQGSPEWFENDIIFPMGEFEREAVRHAQRVLRGDETGVMDQPTRALLRGFQGLFGMRQTGILDLNTAIKIEEIRNQYSC